MTTREKLDAMRARGAVVEFSALELTAMPAGEYLAACEEIAELKKRHALRVYASSTSELRVVHDENCPACPGEEKG